jgi:hypothetical protein
MRRSRVLGIVLSVVLLISACGPKAEIVYIDPKDHDDSGSPAYTPIGRSVDPRVHQDGDHELLEKVEISRPGDSKQSAPYVPIGSSGGPLVDAGGKRAAAPRVLIGLERMGTLADDHTGAASATHGEGASRASAPPAVIAPAPAAPAPASEPLLPAPVAPSPTVPPRLALGNTLAAQASTPTSQAAPAVVVDEDDDLETVSGKIESIVGKSILLETAIGKTRVRLADAVRIERDILGSPADLKAGRFVGVLHAPSGPATSVRLYTTGPSMPRPGVVPMAGSRVGQITTFGSIVALQFGGLLMNAAGETTNVTLLGTVEVLKPVPAGAADLTAGMSLVATGPDKRRRHPRGDRHPPDRPVSPRPLTSPGRRTPARMSYHRSVISSRPST